MDILAENLEKERDLSHSILHIDMDAFYAAVEMLDNSELKEKPMAVGSSSMLVCLQCCRFCPFYMNYAIVILFISLCSYLSQISQLIF